ncbi:MAG TPA: phosphomannomutase/phosphoglucomutase [Rhodanobacteraceae bacterium]|jgi:phosphomannomutase/phosphoglucomutase|nr:phosphomannomutase/phosphoglucomutase [Rhodanobacteraceae bacterium]
MGNDSVRKTGNVQTAARAVRTRLSLRRGFAEVVADLALAVGTLLVLFALFMFWQAWQITRQTAAAQELVQARQQASRKIASIVAARRAEVGRALAQPALVAQLAASDDPEERAAAARRIKAEMEGAQSVTLYSPQLNEVLHGDLQQLQHLGYARAAQLMSTLSGEDLGPAQSPVARTLSFAGPVVGPGDKVLAYATVDFHDSPLRVALHAASVSAGRLELRQTGKSGDIVLDTVGESSLPPADGAGIPIPHSLFIITSAPPNYWLPITRSLVAALALAILTLLVGVALLWSRPRLRARFGGAPMTDEPALSEVIAAAPPVARPEPVPAAKPAPAPASATDDAPIPERGIFRAYDIRGVVGQTLDAGVARQLGRAIGSAVRDKELSEIVVGRDGRLSGPELSDALIEGLRAAGVDVIDIGAAPTPVSYFAAYQLNTGSCVSVTGSHNPPDYNGFKVVIGGETLAEDAIQDLYQRIVDGRLAGGHGSLRQYDILGEYIERIASDIQTGRALKVVVDCGNGIAGNTAPGVVHAIGCEPIPLYCDVDGTFPNHHPDPSEPKNLADLILMVKKTGADLGLAFDGDGDRLGVVTREGEIVYPDRVLMLFAQDVLTRNPGATILYDVKCTGHLQSLILRAGGSPLMWKTGHSLIKAKMKETGAQLAGEMSGHFFFRERWYGFDDGVYAAARLLEILADDPDGRTAEQIFATLPKGVSTPELHIPMQEGESHPFIGRFRERAQFDGARITTIDGLRADWPDGWGLVRASNTTPVLVLRFDADDAVALKRIQDDFRAQLLACDGTLTLPF